MNLFFRTERLLFRDFILSDADSVYRYASDPIVTKMTYWGPYDWNDTERFLQKSILQSEENPRTAFDSAILSVDQGSILIGGCKIYINDVANREAEIGYYLERESWKKGFATETARALLSFGFDHLKLHRIVAMCFVENLASAHVLEKVGFQAEGVLRQHRLKEGKWIDSYLYSILEKKWNKELRSRGLD